MMTFPMTLTDPKQFSRSPHFEVEYLKNGASWRQCFYRTLIGNHTLSIEWYYFQ